ncbi:MAG: PepSY domain-containing protein [Rubrobacter sp.]|nr:PepSY domain-containing protein [Rubrobacter sp.]
MNTRKLVVGAATAAALIVGGAAAIAAGQAPQTTADETKQEDPSYKGSIQAPSGDAERNDAEENAKGSENEAGGDGSEAAEDQQLQSLARIDRAQAQQAALKAVPGTIKDAELGNENGYVVWDVKVAADSGSLQEVKVDAGNGQVLAQDAGDDEDSEHGGEGVANEAAEPSGE